MRIPRLRALGLTCLVLSIASPLRVAGAAGPESGFPPLGRPGLLLAVATDDARYDPRLDPSSAPRNDSGKDIALKAGLLIGGLLIVLAGVAVASSSGAVPGQLPQQR